MKKQMQKIRPKVLKLLIDQPETRFSDAKLYAILTGCPEIEHILKKVNYESVRRTRAKLFEKYPLLAPPDGSDVDNFRKQNEVEIREYLKD